MFHFRFHVAVYFMRGNEEAETSRLDVGAFYRRGRQLVFSFSVILHKRTDVRNPSYMYTPLLCMVRFVGKTHLFLRLVFVHRYWVGCFQAQTNNNKTTKNYIN